MPEFEPRHEVLPPEHWKNFTVSVMSASSNKNKYALENAYEVGKMLPKMGMDGINGGYSAGGMGSFADGFKESARKMGLSDEEIEKHLKGVVYSEKVIGKVLAETRGVNTPASITRADSLPERAGGIIKGSDVVISVEGGAGTAIEALLAAQDQWFREANKDIKLSTRPVILIESSNMIEDTIALFKERVAPMVNEPVEKVDTYLTPSIYVLSGHSNPKIQKESGDLDMATLANDSELRQKLSLLLEYFYLKREKDSGNPFDDKKYHLLEEKLFSLDSPNRVFTVEEKLRAKKEVHGDGEGI